MRTVSSESGPAVHGSARPNAMPPPRLRTNDTAVAGSPSMAASAGAPRFGGAAGATRGDAQSPRDRFPCGAAFDLDFRYKRSGAGTRDLIGGKPRILNDLESHGGDSLAGRRES
jgi:hypothetical protein